MSRTLIPCKWAFDENGPYDGFDTGGLWNGWNNVAITPEVARAINAEYAAKYPHIDPEDRDIPTEPDPVTGLVELGYCYTATILTEEEAANFHETE
jgi:hypothetical protein